MGSETDFYNIWRHIHGKVDVEELPLCRISQEFLAKLEDLIFTPLSAGASLGQIAQAKYELQEEWHAWKKSVPRWHLKTCASHRRCLDQVYEACFDRLNLMQLTHRGRRNLVKDYDELTKTALLPQETTKPVVVSPGIWIGERNE